MGGKTKQQTRGTAMATEGTPEPLAWIQLQQAFGALPAKDWRVSRLARHVRSTPANVEAAIAHHRHRSASSELSQARAQEAVVALLSRSTPTSEIAADCGYTSVSSLNKSLLQQTGLDSPATRALRGANAFRLRLPAHFRVGETMAYLGRDPDSLNLRTTGVRAFAFGLSLDDQCVAVTCEFDSQSRSLSAQLQHRGTASAKVRERAPASAARALQRMLGFSSATTELARSARMNPLLRILTGPRRGMRIPQTAAPIDALVWSILGQQINLPFAYQLLRTATSLCGAPGPLGLFTMPLPARLADTDPAEFTSRKMSRSKARYLGDIAGAVTNQSLDLDALGTGPFAEAYAALVAQRGIGPWTANYTLMRGLGFGDCAPLGDAGLRRALRRFFTLEEAPDDNEMAVLMERFAPYRSLATFHLWRGSDDALPQA